MNFTKSSNAMRRVGQKVTDARKRSVTFTAPIFTKLTVTPYTYLWSYPKPNVIKKKKL